MTPYSVFIHKQVYDFLAEIKRAERDRLLALFDSLSSHPDKEGDYFEQDDTKRKIHVIVLGKYAVLYWSDHPVKEVKIVALRYADKNSG